MILPLIQGAYICCVALSAALFIPTTLILISGAEYSKAGWIICRIWAASFVVVYVGVLVETTATYAGWR